MIGKKHLSKMVLFFVVYLFSTQNLPQQSIKVQKCLTELRHR